MAEKWTPVSPIPASALEARPAAHLVRGKPRDVFDYYNAQGLVGHVYRFEGSDGGDRECRCPTA